jgi:DNA adenine methylase
VIPHPIPYQGSKRRLADVILRHAPASVERFVEPFAGSAAVTLAAARRAMAQRYIIGDSLASLVDVWEAILRRPVWLADKYERLWEARDYLQVRNSFNRSGGPAELLYLLARCVKNAVRFNADGGFNQSADRRREGMRPAKMRAQIQLAHELLATSASTFSGDYSALLDEADRRDFVYMDPPYQGVSGRDSRYFQQLELDRLLYNLDRLNARGVPYLLSFDGVCGARTYGVELPKELKLTRMWVNAGRSSQATLNGRDEHTVESLYLSPAMQKANTR